jgi:hypothetical protein
MADKKDADLDDTDPGEDWVETDDAEVDIDVDVDDDEFDDDVDPAVVADLDDDGDDEDLGADIDGDLDLDDDDDEDGEALDELEAEELEMLTEDEAAESLPVDEAEELREIRRAALALEAAAESAGAGEFVCMNCFLVKSTVQLADKRKKFCRDCA